MSVIQDFILLWRESPPLQNLLKSLTCFQFILLNSLSSTNLPSSPQLILYKYKQPLWGEEGVSLREVNTLTVGKMHPLVALNEQFGYLLEFPNIPLVFGPGYVAAGGNRVSDITDTEITVKSPQIHVFSTENAVVCIGKVHLSLVDRYGFHYAG